MNPDQIDLARRAVACKAWRWMPGMVGWRTAHDGGQVRVRFVESVEDFELADPRVSVRKPSMTPIFAWGYGRQAGWHEVSTVLPDLADPATLGCLTALVREAWRDHRLVAIYCEAAHPGQSEGWAVQAADNRMPVAGEDYATEAEALVAALEAAP